MAVAGTAMIAVSQMFLARKPSRAQIREVVASQANAGFSYREAGMTRDHAPPGYQCRQQWYELGSGCGLFECAKQAIREWRMFDIGWIELGCSDAAIQPGSTVAVCAQHFGFWSINVCRIVYTIDEPRRYGLAYGTLPEHAETGEERFTVEWRDDDSVRYEILAFSREKHPLAKVAYPLSRMLQARFRRDSGLAMQRAVAKAGAPQLGR